MMVIHNWESPRSGGPGTVQGGAVVNWAPAAHRERPYMSHGGVSGAQNAQHRRAATWAQGSLIDATSD